METTDSLWVVFFAYMGAMPIFADIYYRLFKSRRSAFFFIREIHSGRHDEEARRIEDEVRELLLVIDYFQQVPASRDESDHVDGRGSVTFRLSDGRTIQLLREYNTDPAGNLTDEIEPTMILRRADGTEEVNRILRHCGPLGQFEDGHRYLINALRSLRHALSWAQDTQSKLATGEAQIWRYVDFLYFSIVTQTTLGYGDILPNSSVVRFFVAVQVIYAYVILVFVLNHLLSA